MPEAPIPLEKAIGMAFQLHQQAKLDEAEQLYRQILQAVPDQPHVLHFLGALLFQKNDSANAVLFIEKALSLVPDLPGAHINLAKALREVGRIQEAIEHYRIALSTHPDPNGFLTLGNLLKDTADLAEAELAYRRAIDLQPECAEAYSNLGSIALEGKRLKEAEELCLQAVRLKPDFALAHHNLGKAYQAQVRLSEALESFKQAFTLDPQLQEARGAYLFTRNYDPNVTAEELAADYRALCLGVGTTAAARFPRHDRNPERRLRIGYVSPDFNRHVCAHFMEPLFVHHDRSQIELHCFAEEHKRDDVTDSFQSRSDHWLNTRGLSDEEVARHIQEHQIDILVDVAGHTVHNRLGVFALKPAPIQVTWPVGSGYTSGLTAIDYFLTDEHFLPPGCDHLVTETPFRLPGPVWIFRPPAYAPEVGPLPTRKNGTLTFGCFSRPIRLNERVVAVWARILREIPNARLMLNSKPFQNGDMRALFTERFAAQGIESDRLIFHVTQTPQETLEAYGMIDIALDPFPHNAGTTSNEALWMGVPVLTLKDRPPLGRLGTGHLSYLGLTEFVADAPDAYVRIAVEWSQRLDDLAGLRTSLRNRVSASLLRDEPQFVRNMESAYRQMWHGWCRDGAS